MTRTILLGIDGATWDNLMPWIKQGKLPYLKELLKTGVWGVNKTTIPGLSCPAMPSFFTGMHPTKTRTFGFRKDDGSVISAKEIKGDRFWDVLGRKGINSFICGAIYPEKIKNGVIISSILTPPKATEFIYPRAEKKFFKNFFGKEISKNQRVELQRTNKKKLLNLFWENQKKGIDIAKGYLGKRDFKFIYLYIGFTDPLQHNFWKSQELILEGYQRLEQELKKFLKEYDSWNMLAFSDHGFGKSPEKLVYVNEFLKRNKCLKFRSNLLSYLYYKAYYLIGWHAEKYLPAKAYERLFSLIKKSDKKNSKNPGNQVNLDPCETQMNFLDKHRTKAYLSQKWGISIIRKNVNNYHAFRNRLISLLRGLTDRKTKQKIFKEVHKKEELYKGSQDYEEIPDIIFTLNAPYEARAGPNPKIITKRDVERRVEGSHEYQRDGIFMAWGPDIKRGGKISRVEIYDIAPTILHMYQVAVPKELDGRVLKEIFRSDSGTGKRRVQYEGKEEKIRRNFEENMFKSIALKIKQNKIKQNKIKQNMNHNTKPRTNPNTSPDTNRERKKSKKKQNEKI